MIVHLIVSAALAALAALSPLNPAQTAEEFGNPDFVVISDTEIYADGVRYDSWDALAASGYFRQLHTRCGTHPLLLNEEDGSPAVRSSPSDCTMNLTRVLPAYEPGVSKLRIPVVVHVIQRTNGTGFIPESRVRSQIDILNEDFLALAGTNGAPGTDTQIEFYLATEDPDGNPTTGITYSVNNTWYNDGGSYWNTLSWDANRYLNIYTNSASGALGYVPYLPQEGSPGSRSDRVVVLHSSFGRNAPISTYNLGRTATHEVGHYLGLFHTFDFGCASTSGCASNGDRICDTNPEASPTYGCPGSRTSCGLPAPFDNYMDYTDDACMNRFTPNQANRMRCTLMNYRPNLYTVDDPTPPCTVDLAPPFGTLNLFDVLGFLSIFQDGGEQADFNLDGSVNVFDVFDFLEAFEAGCP